MKVKELQNIILGVLYTKKLTAVSGFHSLFQISKAIDDSILKDEVVDIAKYLETKDYIKLISEIDDIYAQLTAYGRDFVEDLLETGALKNEYLQTVSRSIDSTVQDQMDIEVPSRERIRERRKSQIDILKSLKRKLGKAVNPDTYDLKIDIEIIILELQKITPDTELIKRRMIKLTFSNVISKDIKLLYSNLNLDF